VALKAVIQKRGDLALLMPSGAPLWEEGKKVGNNSIDRNGQRFRYLAKSLDVRPLKGKKTATWINLRQTGASMMELGADHKHARWVDHFLGHAPRDTTELYIHRDSPLFQASFDAAVEAVGKALGIYNI
jgi:hypothetical protein